MVLSDVECIQLSSDEGQWQAFENTVMNVHLS